MIVRHIVFIAASASLALAAQPSAPSPVAAPLRDLQWGQLNVLHTSDTHGWIGGHLEQPSYSADWGDYISFAKHLRDRADRDGVDLLLVDTGDRVEGNGLYDASTPRGKYVFDIFKQQEIDLICSGNHELYKASSANDEFYQTVPNFQGKYLATNLDIENPETGNLEPLAARYKKFTTKNQGIRVLAFGFLFNFEGNANNTVVRKVGDVMKDKEFQDVIRSDDIDLILVIGHSPVRGDEFKLIHDTITSARWDIPIQFFGGHTHTRDFKIYDGTSTALESGRYMETIGFLSISGLPHASSSDSEDEEMFSAKKGLTFNRRYIDNNLFSFRHHANVTKSDFDTKKGLAVSKAIAKARSKLRLDHLYGCSPGNYWVARAPYPGKHSVFTLLEEKLLPDTVGKAYLDQIRSAASGNRPGIPSGEEDRPALIITNTGAIRFDIFAGQFTRDTAYLVSPFTSSFKILGDVPYSSAKNVMKLLNNKGNIWSTTADDDVINKAGFYELMRALGRAGLAPSEQRAQERKMADRDEGSDMASWPPNPLMGQDQIVLQPGGDSRSHHSRPPSHEDDGDLPISAQELFPGYTTKDDAGSDGDDTEHEPIKTYSVPNCIQSEFGFSSKKDDAEPEKVDIVYNEYVEPWILRILRFLGEEYDEGDAKELEGGKRLTEYITEWVEENWEAKDGKC